MRKLFFKTLIKLAQKDKDIILLTDDLGYSFYEKYAEKLPNQFINCGCMEQSMIGIACGLAMSGKKVYIYGTTNFLLFRALEQVRNDIVQQKLNIKIIGTTHSGFLGFSHNLLHSKEDINLCENIGLKSYKPSLKTLEKLLIKTYNNKETCYIRL